MKKVYDSLWLIVILSIVVELICVCFDWTVVSMVVAVILVICAILLCVIYMVFVKHKCPKCGTVFKGNKVEVFFAPHSATKRYMRCPMCNIKLWCEDCFEKVKTKSLEETDD